MRQPPGLPFWARGLLETVALLLLPPRGSLAVKCNDPVVENGVRLNGVESLYTLNSSVSFECRIGYFMIGSYVSRCDENGTWNPAVPTCKKISPHLCGAPLIPSGSVHPLKPEYNFGMSIVVFCSPHFCFPDGTIEMAATCEGYNRWDPPVQPCFFRTSPDSSALHISNGRIVRGKKRQYEPGDKVTIQCHAGYVLKGPSVIRYIGGKKWLPKVPRCSLSVFFILLIVACILIVLLLVVKMLWKGNR